MKAIPHGTPNAYTNYGCRCDKCRATWSAYIRELCMVPCSRCGESHPGRYSSGVCRKCRTEIQREHLVHGNETGYNRGCRCEDCKKAGAAARRRRRHANLEAENAYQRAYKKKRRAALRSEGAAQK